MKNALDGRSGFRMSLSLPHPYKVLPVTCNTDDASAVGLDALSKLPIFAILILVDR